jgi:hypothetical protein
VLPCSPGENNLRVSSGLRFLRSEGASHEWRDRSILNRVRVSFEIQVVQVIVREQLGNMLEFSYALPPNDDLPGVAEGIGMQ